MGNITKRWKEIKVLIACEESQRVCTEMRKLGYEAYSCDILPAGGDHPEWHVCGDAIPLVNGKCDFTTQDGVKHTIDGKWDLLIAHPPCTYLTCASAIRLFNKDGTIKDYNRYKLGTEAAVFFYSFLYADCDHICVENPVPLKCFGLPRYDQVIEPYMFGEPWKKRTCLWLRGLPKLQPTDTVEPKGLWIGSTSGQRDNTIYKRYEYTSKRNQRERSRTFIGIAKAIAKQFGGYVEAYENNHM